MRVEHPLADVKGRGMPSWRPRRSGMKAMAGKNIEVRSPTRQGRAEECSAPAVFASAAFARKTSPAANGEKDKHSN